MSLKRTPLFSAHVALNAQLVDFGGWEMPVRYAGDIVEHMAVRKHVGMFDVSHMGEVRIKGKRALDAVNMLLTNDIDAIVEGQAMYGCMLNPEGGIIDDIVAYRFSKEDVLLCVNASNQEKDATWIKRIVTEHFAPADAFAEDESAQFGQIAVQGPSAAEVISRLFGKEIQKIKRYHFAEIEGHIVARTGYTGEDGFEIFTRSRRTHRLHRRGRF